MYSARFETDDGRKFRFGYEYGVLVDIDPLSEIDVGVATSQGFQQIGETVENFSVGGISRKIAGKIMGYANDKKKELLHVFTPFTSGRLYFNQTCYCDAVVEKTPTIGVQDRDVAFSLVLFCPYPYWKSTLTSEYVMGGYSKAFLFPVNYGQPHMFGIQNASAFTNCRNDGVVPVPFSVEFSTKATTENYGLINIYTLEYIKVFDTLNLGDTVKIYRKDGRLHVEKQTDGETEDLFFALDEESNLFTLQSGDNVLKLTADDGEDNLQAVVSFNDAFIGVYDGM